MKQYGPLIGLLLVTLAIELVLIGADLSKAKQGEPGVLATRQSAASGPSLGGGREVPTIKVPVAPVSAPPIIVPEIKAEPAPAPKPKPKPKPLVPAGPLVIPARAWIAVYVSPQGERRVLTSHNETTPYPIASLSKLLTAIVARKNIDPKTTLTLNSELEVLSDSQAASLTSARTVAAIDLLFPLLVESNNNAATALASVLGEENFVNKMNKMARTLGMSDTYLVNPHGLDPTDGSRPNEGSAADLERLAEAYVKNYLALLNITKQEQFALWSLDHKAVRRFTNTNRLIDSNNWPAEVLGGKTGYTDLADHNLLLVLHDKAGGGFLYTVVLGTNNHFAATSDLLNWVYARHQF